MMDILNTVPWWILFLVGLVIGSLAMQLYLSTKHDGSIYVTHGEETDKYLFEFNIPPEQIPKMKQVVFAVKIITEEPQNLQAIE